MARKADSKTAKSKKKSPEEATRFADVKVRKEMIAACGKDWMAQQREIDALQEKIKPLKKIQSELVTKLSADLGLDKAKIAWVIKNLILEDPAGTGVDTIREVYAALKPGEQVDWIDAQRQQKEAPSEAELAAAGAAQAATAGASAPATLQ